MPDLPRRRCRLPSSIVSPLSGTRCIRRSAAGPALFPSGFPLGYARSEAGQSLRSGCRSKSAPFRCLLPACSCRATDAPLARTLYGPRDHLSHLSGLWARSFWGTGSAVGDLFAPAPCFPFVPRLCPGCGDRDESVALPGAPSSALDAARSVAKIAGRSAAPGHHPGPLCPCSPPAPAPPVSGSFGLGRLSAFCS